MPPVWRSEFCAYSGTAHLSVSVTFPLPRESAVGAATTMVHPALQRQICGHHGRRLASNLKCAIHAAVHSHTVIAQRLM